MDLVDILKKTFDFGLGAAALSVEKLKCFADEMVSRGEMTSEDARKFVDDVSAKADEQKRSLNEWISEQISKMLQQAGAAEAAHVDRLETRIASLERRVAELSADVITRHPTDENKIGG